MVFAIQCTFKIDFKKRNRFILEVGKMDELDFRVDICAMQPLCTVRWTMDLKRSVTHGRRHRPRLYLHGRRRCCVTDAEGSSPAHVCESECARTCDFSQHRSGGICDCLSATMLIIICEPRWTDVCTSERVRECSVGVFVCVRACLSLLKSKLEAVLPPGCWALNDIQALPTQKGAVAVAQ